MAALTSHRCEHRSSSDPGVVQWVEPALRKAKLSDSVSVGVEQQLSKGLQGELIAPVWPLDEIPNLAGVNVLTLSIVAV